jgi:ParB family chromosome partitioning protein
MTPKPPRQKPLKTKPPTGAGWSSLERKPRSWNISPGATAPHGSHNQVADVPVDAITPDPKQPRRIFNKHAIADLARSIRQDGLLEPILIRPTEPGKYQLIAGERRWRATRELGHPTIRALVSQASEQQAFKLSLVENLQREQLNVIERGLAFRRLLNDGLYKTHEELARDFGLSRPTVTKSLSVLERLNADAVDYYLLNGEQLTDNHLDAIRRVPPDKQRPVLERAVKEKWTIRQTRDHIASRFLKRSRPPVSVHERAADWFEVSVRIRPAMPKNELDEALIGLRSAIERIEKLTTSPPASG